MLVHWCFPQEWWGITRCTPGNSGDVSENRILGPQWCFHTPLKKKKPGPIIVASQGGNHPENNLAKFNLATEYIYETRTKKKNTNYYFA
jgi:hypothetical protein